jgi:hypothetical protein
MGAFLDCRIHAFSLSGGRPSTLYNIASHVEVVTVWAGAFCFIIGRTRLCIFHSTSVCHWPALVLIPCSIFGFWATYVKCAGAHITTHIREPASTYVLDPARALPTYLSALANFRPSSITTTAAVYKHYYRYCFVAAAVRLGTF